MRLKQLEPLRVKPFGKKNKGVMVAASTHSFYVLNDKGEVYSWGVGKFGRLGHGNNENQKTPKKIEYIKNIKSISAKNWNAGAIDNDDDCFVWGSIMKNNKPKKIESLKVKKVSFGGDFVVFLTLDGELYSMGNNSSLQCGVKGKGKIESPKLLMKGKKFVEISCGYHNAMAICDDNTVWMWGDNSWGQLCNGKKDSKKRLPFQIKLPDKKWVQCSCSVSDKYCHAGIVSEDGVMYMWGSNYKGKLGNGTTKDSYKCIVNDKVKNVKKLICGGIHNYLMDNSNNLFTFGCGSDGRLGHPECEGHRYLYKEYIPRIIDPLKEGVLDVASSYYAGIALAKKKKKKEN